MTVNVDRGAVIKTYYQRNMSQFKKELEENGSYEKWFEALEEFRTSLKRYYKYSIGGVQKMKRKILHYTHQRSAYVDMMK